MVRMPVSQVRARMSTLGERVARKGERVIVQRRGKDVFALVPVEDVELLERLEDRLDLDAVRAAEAEPSVPWARVKKALGL